MYPGTAQYTLKVIFPTFSRIRHRTHNTMRKSTSAIVLTVSALLALEGALGFIPASAFGPSSLMHRGSSAHARKSGALCLRAQEETRQGLPATGLGWEKRPASSLTDSKAPKTRDTDMKISQKGEVKIDGHVLAYDAQPALMSFFSCCPCPQVGLPPCRFQLTSVGQV